MGDNSFDTADLVIVGEELAGIWYATRWADWQTQLGRPYPKILLLRTQPNYPVRVTSAATAARFRLPAVPATPFQLVSKEGVLDWHEIALRQAFSGLPDFTNFFAASTGDTGPNAAQLLVLRHLVRSHPELIGFADAVLKAAGDAAKLAPEPSLWQALQLTQLVSYSPGSLVHPLWEVRDFGTAAGELAGVNRTKTEGLRLRFSAGGAIGAKQWVLNLRLFAFDRLFGRSSEFLGLLNQDPRPYSDRTLYPIVFRFQSGCLPVPVPPRFIWFDSTALPDNDSEVWPVEIERTPAADVLRIWATAECGVPLESCLHQAHLAFQRVFRLFPDAAPYLLQVFPSLGLGACHQDADRSAAIEALGLAARDRYSLTTPLPETSTKDLWNFMPIIGNHLPFPAGGLLAAETLLRRLMGRREAAKQFEVPTQVR